MSKLTKEQHEVLLSNPHLGTLSCQLRETLVSLGRLRSHHAGEQLHRCGAPPSGFSIIVEGAVRLCAASLTGEEAVLAIYAPGQWYGEVPSLDGQLSTYDIYAHEKTTVLNIALDDFRQLCAEYPEFVVFLLLGVSAQLRTMWLVFEAYITIPVNGLIAGRLLELAQSFGFQTAEGLRIEIRLTLATLAQMVGATRQRVWQVLKAFERAGLIRQESSQITLLDKRGIERLAIGYPLPARMSVPKIKASAKNLLKLQTIRTREVQACI